MLSDRKKSRRGDVAGKHEIELPAFDGHPNRLTFEGVLTILDRPSERAPSGARGHRVILTKETAHAALPSLLGMAVDYRSGWTGHDARQKCGIITHAEIVGDCINVRGFVFAKDFPEVEERLKDEPDRMGMSYELADAHVADMRSAIWVVTRATFVGAAILLREKAAYSGTRFRLTGSRPKSTALQIDGKQEAEWFPST